MEFDMSHAGSHSLKLTPEETQTVFMRPDNAPQLADVFETKPQKPPKALLYQQQAFQQQRQNRPIDNRPKDKPRSHVHQPRK